MTWPSEKSKLGAGNRAPATELRKQYPEALGGDALAAYWLESASASVMADYINGDVVTIKA